MAGWLQSCRRARAVSGSRIRLSLPNFLTPVPISSHRLRTWRSPRFRSSGGCGRLHHAPRAARASCTAACARRTTPVNSGRVRLAAWRARQAASRLGYPAVTVLTWDYHRTLHDPRVSARRREPISPITFPSRRWSLGEPAGTNRRWSTQCSWRRTPLPEAACKPMVCAFEPRCVQSSSARCRQSTFDAVRFEPALQHRQAPASGLSSPLPCPTPAFRDPVDGSRLTLLP